MGGSGGFIFKAIGRFCAALREPSRLPDDTLALSQSEAGVDRPCVQPVPLDPSRLTKSCPQRRLRSARSPFRMRARG
ncbi:MAG: hypothetical protein EDS66_04260 [Planctomycetota bacterium]|nr:MAG: hypothetical protein EDS66_04260 [Planctomycetota bacterium]MCQ3920638.1 hypothetical protein [Planctomycetota bacterium]